MSRNQLQVACLLVTGILLSGCNSKSPDPGQATKKDPATATLADVLRNQRIHFEIEKGDTRETGWFQVGDDDLVAWGKENHYSLTTFGQKERSLFVVNGSQCIEVRFGKAGVAVGDTITLIQHNLGGRDLETLLKSTDDADADNVRAGTIVNIEEKQLLSANSSAHPARLLVSRPGNSPAKES